MAFNLNDYETVKQRKKRFYATHPDGRVTVDLVSRDSIEEYALFKASVFLSSVDQEKNLPRGVGFALEMRDKERPKNQYGKEYDSVNFTSWTENCEESAVGRALDNAGFFSDPKCSREEIEKSQRQAKTLFKTSENQVNPLNTPLPKSSAKFEIPIGKNKGKTLDQLTTDEIESFVKWGRMQKDLKGPALTTVQEMERFLSL
jgi:hypothetical protein